MFRSILISFSFFLSISINAQEKHDSILVSVSKTYNIKISLDAIYKNPSLICLDSNFQIINYELRTGDYMSGSTYYGSGDLIPDNLLENIKYENACFVGKAKNIFDDKVYDFKTFLEIYYPVQEKKEKITPDSCHIFYYMKILEVKINEYFKRNVMYELTRAKGGIFFMQFKKMGINYVTINTYSKELFTVTEINKLLEYLNNQKELFANCSFKIKFVEFSMYNESDSIQYMFMLPSSETRIKYTPIIKDPRPKVKFKSNKYKSEYESIIDYYSMRIEKKLKKIFNRNIIKNLILNKKYISVNFAIWPNDSIKIWNISSNDPFFTDNAKTMLNEYLEKNLTLKYRYYEQFEDGVKMDLPYGSRMDYNIMIPNSFTRKRYKIKD